MSGDTARRRILFVTATRADFGKLKPLIREVMLRPQFECRIFATGMHMLSRYGSTINEVYRSGFENVYPYVNQDGSINTQMDLVLANTVQGLGHFLREFPQDLVVVHGDRVETLAGAIVGALNNTLVAHIEGGEISGTVDELIRHAVSKLSHLHFVANEDARARLLQMGEMRESIFVVGSPDIDVMLSESLPCADEVRVRYDVPFGDYTILLYHPVTTEVVDLRAKIAAVVSAVERSGRNFVVLYPNNDTGSDVILEAILRLEGHPRFRILPSMRFEYFLSLLKHAQALVGNSSSVRCAVGEHRHAAAESLPLSLHRRRPGGRSGDSQRPRRPSPCCSAELPLRPGPERQAVRHVAPEYAGVEHAAAEAVPRRAGQS